MKKLETETSAPNSPKGRETGLVVRLFSTPPQIFGIAQHLERERDSNGGQGDLAGDDDLGALGDFDPRPPLEEEALNLSRMLKTLRPPEKFPGFPVESMIGELPDALESASHGIVAPAAKELTSPQQKGFSFDNSAAAAGPIPAITDDEQQQQWASSGGRSNGGPPISGTGGTNRNDESSSAGGTTMMAWSPGARNPKSNRKMYGPSYSKSSTPNTSGGSASELLFPTFGLRSPPSPEPLGNPRPGSPLKWRTKPATVSPVEEALAPPSSRASETRDTSVQELVAGGRSKPAAAPSSDYPNGKVPFQDTRRSVLDVGVSNDPHPPFERKDSPVARKTNASAAFLESETRGMDHYSTGSQGPPITPRRQFPRVDLQIAPPPAPDSRSLIQNRPIYNGNGNGNGNGSDTSPSGYRSPSVSNINPFQILFREGVRVRNKSRSNISSSQDVSPPYTSPPSSKSSESPKSSGLDIDSSSGPRPVLESSFRFVTEPTTSKEELMAEPTMSREEGEEQQQQSREALPVPLSSEALSRSDSEHQDASLPSPYPVLSSEVQPEERFAQSPSESHDDEFDLGPKTDFLPDSGSSPSYDPRNILPIAKSEPVGRWPSTNSSSHDDAALYSGHRPRSMSLPGNQASNSLPPTPSDAALQARNGQHQRRKGECYSCYKGNRLTEKEACLACESKYCCNCVLSAMESMPEGRKCRTCIGKPVQEAKRIYIGKPSRLLSRLLSPQEVQQIMKAERECAANQLRPEQLFVNGKQLTPEELSYLLKCPNPPQKLKPGRYWYDSQSGLWGKEGERPDKLISPDMKLGGVLQENASNGSTQVYMNNRELGKLEVKMLKLAGVHCPPSTHLWVEPDGSYQEEGQNFSKGNIWNKASIRLLYPFFSLPTPGASGRYTARETPRDSPDIYGDFAIQNKLHKILVLGHEGSGRSTLFKQTKFIFKDGFKREERLEMKSMIQQHIYRYIGILLEGRERFEEEAEDLEQNRRCATGDYPGETSISSYNVYALNSRLKEQAKHITDVVAEGSFDERTSTNSSEFHGHVVDQLWRDPAIQETFRRKDELNNLPVAAGYFLDKAIEITSIDYEPTDEDILRAEGLAQGSGLAEVEFFLDEKLPHQDHDTTSPSRFQLIKVGGNGLMEGCKWLDMFEDIHAVVFVVAISEYDQVLTDKDGVTRSKLRQKELFDSVLKHTILGEKPMVLLLNKYDVFEDKICTGIPLTSCEWFSDFRPVGASQMTAQMQAQQGYTYVVHKYKELFQASGHKLFTFKLNAIERDKVLEAFHYVREILNWRDNSWDLFPEESSAYSTDLSSYSHHHLHAPRQDGFLIDR